MRNLQKMFFGALFVLLVDVCNGGTIKSSVKGSAKEGECVMVQPNTAETTVKIIWTTADKGEPVISRIQGPADLDLKKTYDDCIGSFEGFVSQVEAWGQQTAEDLEEFGQNVKNFFENQWKKP